MAAYESVTELHWGIVAKIDVGEIRTTFVRAAILAAGVAWVLILCGVVRFPRISNPHPTVP